MMPSKIPTPVLAEGLRKVAQIRGYDMSLEDFIQWVDLRSMMDVTQPIYRTQLELYDEIKSEIMAWPEGGA